MNTLSRAAGALSVVCAAQLAWAASPGGAAPGPITLDPAPPKIAAGVVPTISVGDISLLKNTPNQTIDITVSGNVPVQGVNLYIQIADGHTAVGGTIDGPNITATDPVAGTIFAANNNYNAANPGNSFNPQFVYVSFTTASGTVNTSGKLVTITVDTTGFFEGAWDLSLADVAALVAGGPFDTDFAGIDASITNGIIHVPEPGTMTIVAAVLIATVRRRRHKGD
jgi:hypothetical protein